MVLAHPPERDFITSFRRPSRKDVFFVSTENSYEEFRTVLIMNLCSAVTAEQMPAVLAAVDITMDDFEICRKQMAIITADGLPDVVKH